jgi:hypothetical protein
MPEAVKTAFEIPKHSADSGYTRRNFALPESARNSPASASGDFGGSSRISNGFAHKARKRKTELKKFAMAFTVPPDPVEDQTAFCIV